MSDEQTMTAPGALTEDEFKRYMSLDEGLATDSDYSLAAWQLSKNVLGVDSADGRWISGAKHDAIPAKEYYKKIRSAIEAGSIEPLMTEDYHLLKDAKAKGPEAVLQLAKKRLRKTPDFSSRFDKVPLNNEELEAVRDNLTPEERDFITGTDWEQTWAIRQGRSAYLLGSPEFDKALADLDRGQAIRNKVKPQLKDHHLRKAYEAQVESDNATVMMSSIAESLPDQAREVIQTAMASGRNVTNAKVVEMFKNLPHETKEDKETRRLVAQLLQSMQYDNGKSFAADAWDTFVNGLDVVKHRVCLHSSRTR